MVNVYILKLQDEKYYVGKTDNLDVRIKQHFDGCGCAWTNKYPPTEVIEKIENCDNFDEDKITKQYMARYGIENVRGASYSQIELNVDIIEQITKEICSSLNLCFKCHRSSHYTSKCWAKTRLDGSDIKEEVGQGFMSYMNSFFKYCSKLVSGEKRKVYVCFRCQRPGHFAGDCFSIYNMKGEFLKPTLIFK